MSVLASREAGHPYIGIGGTGPDKRRKWTGFPNQEAANGHLQIFEKLFPLGNDFQYEFLRAEARSGVVLHVQVNKTQEIKRASNSMPYIRRGAQGLPVDTPESLRRLEYPKGLTSFETESTNVPIALITQSDTVRAFIREAVPTAEPENWLRKQILIKNDQPTVAGLLLFSEEPQAVMPKRCGIKLY